MEVFNKLSNFDIFWYMDVLEVFYFNQTKAKITWKISTFGFLDYKIILDDQLYM